MPTCKNLREFLVHAPILQPKDFRAPGQEIPGTRTLDEWFYWIAYDGHTMPQDVGQCDTEDRAIASVAKALELESTFLRAFQKVNETWHSMEWFVTHECKTKGDQCMAWNLTIGELRRHLKRKGKK